MNEYPYLFILKSQLNVINLTNLEIINKSKKVKY